MRRKVEEGKGDHVIRPDDPTGRLMKRVGAGKGNYEVFSEGLDDDGDGKYNEDGIGGLDSTGTTRKTGGPSRAGT